VTKIENCFLLTQILKIQGLCFENFSTFKLSLKLNFAIMLRKYYLKM